MQKVYFNAFLITSGSLIFLFSLSFDWLYQGSPGIGFTQFVGMTIGLISILIGLRYILLPKKSMWDWALFAVYFSGILIVGLRPTDSDDNDQNPLLSTETFSNADFSLNIAGFVPLGFLLLPLIEGCFRDDNKVIKLIAIATFVGFFTSLTIEILQYLWIPGRISSAYDLTTNTLGSTIGALGYSMLFYRKFRSLNC